MVTFGLLAVILLIGFLVVSIPPAAETAWRTVVIWTCWVPVTALALAYLESHAIASAFGYAGIGVALIICGVSGALATAGARLLTAQRQRTEHDTVLVAATLIAAIPAVLLAVELARETIVGVVHAIK